MYYPCSENKGADQLCGYREADLRLCFRIGKNPVFSRCGSIMITLNHSPVMLRLVMGKAIRGSTDMILHKLAKQTVQNLVF